MSMTYTSALPSVHRAGKGESLKKQQIHDAAALQQLLNEARSKNCAVVAVHKDFGKSTPRAPVFALLPSEPSGNDDNAFTSYTFQPSSDDCYFLAQELECSSSCDLTGVYSEFGFQPLKVSFSSASSLSSCPTWSTGCSGSSDQILEPGTGFEATTMETVPLFVAAEDRNSTDCLVKLPDGAHYKQLAPQISYSNDALESAILPMDENLTTCEDILAGPSSTSLLEMLESTALRAELEETIDVAPDEPCPSPNAGGVNQGQRIPDDVQHGEHKQDPFELRPKLTLPTRGFTPVRFGGRSRQISTSFHGPISSKHLPAFFMPAIQAFAPRFTPLDRTLSGLPSRSLGLNLSTGVVPARFGWGHVRSSTAIS
ncbi:hypothetical protein K474DRAFT_804524 [Panus rudis PR-1116 ss-1]|nr:hypothetical protein K474DRAFT_804524 [Panus rudis PR-1116 ss-1]